MLFKVANGIGGNFTHTCTITKGSNLKYFRCTAVCVFCMSVSVIFVLRERLALSAFFKSFHVIATEMT